MTILIKFPDQATEQRALGKLIPRFSGRSWVTGETAVPASALAYLAEQGIQFNVIGPAPYRTLRRYEILVPLVLNDGTPVAESLLAETFSELRAQSAASSTASS